MVSVGWLQGLSWAFFRPAVPTNTSESLCSVTVSDSNDQWEEVDLTEPSNGMLEQTVTTAGANGANCHVTITNHPFCPGVTMLQLVLTATL